MFNSKTKTMEYNTVYVHISIFYSSKLKKLIVFSSFSLMLKFLIKMLHFLYCNTYSTHECIMTVLYGYKSVIPAPKTSVHSFFPTLLPSLLKSKG